MAAHAKLSASSSDRWMLCPGSIRLSENIPSTTSIYAEEGTKAHDLASLVLENKHFELTDYDTEMIDNVSMYVDYILSLPYSTRLIEHKFDLSSIYPGMFGTSDCTIYDSVLKRLQVIDLKYGKGLFVHVENNSQLMYYALGALTELKLPVNKITMTIVQPRFKSSEIIRSHTIDSIELFDWSIDLVNAAKKTELVDAPLVKGRHCKFCSAKSVCPEFKKTNLENAMLEFSSSIVDEGVSKSTGGTTYEEFLKIRHGD
jgi:hypothetical protein